MNQRGSAATYSSSWLGNASLSAITGPLLCLLAALSVMWFSNFGFPAVNNIFHIPLVLKYADSLEGPHDTFHESLKYFISFFWPAVAAIANEQNIRSIFLVLLAAGNAVTILAAYRLTVAAGAPRKIAAAGCGLLAFGGREFLEYGNGELLSGFLTHSQFATAGCLLALAMAIQRRWLVAAAICGFTANVNLFMAFWSIGTLLLMRLVVEGSGRRAEALGSSVSMGALCALMASPAIVWALQSPQMPVDQQFSFREFLYQFEPRHSFTHIQLGAFLNFAVLSVATWILPVDRNSPPGLALLSLLFRCSTAALFVGAIAVYLFDNPLLQNLYPLRFAAVIHWLAACLAIGLWGDAVRRHTTATPFAAIAVVGFFLTVPTVALFGLLFYQWQQPRVTWIESCLMFCMAAALAVPVFHSVGTVGEISRFGPVPVIAITASACAALVATCYERGLGWSILCAAAVVFISIASHSSGPGAAIPIASISALMIFLLKREQANPAIVSGVIAVALSVLLLFGFEEGELATVAGSLVLAAGAFCAVRWGHVRLPWSDAAVTQLVILVLCLLGFRQAVLRNFDFPTWPLAQNWTAAQRWAREHTPPDTLFYSPDRSGFATLSRRPVWWDDGEGAAGMWSPSFFREWERRRLQAGKANTLKLHIELARQENIRFLVFPKSRLQPVDTNELSIRYCNADFCIAEVQGAGPL